MVRQAHHERNHSRIDGGSPRTESLTARRWLTTSGITHGLTGSPRTGSTHLLLPGKGWAPTPNGTDLSEKVSFTGCIARNNPTRHPGESRGPAPWILRKGHWVPAFAGTTGHKSVPFRLRPERY